ncbi:hypothetical protein WICMUC_000910 [Wickerhamomyces mucosus]|uniref:Uncharacterized protein n=1 Tax=Wickerhamomyces mucosus TaxID=1378264 RepID=A0A9P8PW67_9ASCO|nr:hypothetical protein WICMUC_000910 [Wickerhamomyces mucosus]
MSKPRVLLIGDIDLSLHSHARYSSNFELIDYKITTRERFLEDFSTNSEYFRLNGIFSGWPAGGGVGKFDSELVGLIKLNSPDLKIITTCAVGYDAFDLTALKEHGITLTNTPSLGAEDVADLVLWHTLESFRYFSKFQNHLAEYPNTVESRGILENQKYKYPFGHIYHQHKIESPRGKRVGICGFGKIGQNVAKRLDTIGMEILYYSRNEVKDAQLPFKFTYQPNLKELVAEVDLLVLSLPGNSSTFHLIDEALLQHAKDGIRIINVGRGPIIDFKAIVNALDSGRVQFLGVDVFYREPEVEEELLKRDNISFTPHIGSSTARVFNETAEFCLKNLEKVLIKGESAESAIV